MKIKYGPKMWILYLFVLSRSITKSPKGDIFSRFIEHSQFHMQFMKIWATAHPCRNTVASASLVSLSSNHYERIIKIIANHLKSNNILNANSMNFAALDPADVLNIMHKIREAFSDKHTTKVIVVDISKAFDKFSNSQVMEFPVQPCRLSCPSSQVARWRLFLMANPQIPIRSM